jgi:quercetin dioxygenase-like cupin family protein
VTVAAVEFNTTDRRENTMRLNKKRSAMAGVGLIAALVLILALTVLPSSAQTPPAPIATEFLTGRATFSDDVHMKFKLTFHGLHKKVVRVADPSRTVVARYTVQPGAQFPWHSHAGPVVVTIVSGELTYMPADDCSERKYPAGTSFVDAGQGHVHSAKNAGTEPVVFVATFFDAPADGPLLIPATPRCQ